MILKTQFSSKVDFSGFGTELFKCWSLMASESSIDYAFDLESNETIQGLHVVLSTTLTGV